MAQEDKSVRKIVQEIESRTGKLDSAIEKLSDSLNRISESLAKPKDEGPEREDLLKKFKQPFATPEAVKTESNSDELLDQIKDALVFNQKDNFSLFKSIDDTLKKIESKGGSLVGGVDIGRGGKSAKGKAAKAAVSADKTVPKKGAVEKKAAGGVASKVGSGLAKAAKFLPGVGLAVTGGMAAMDAYSSYNEAEKVLGIEDREATFGEKVSAGLGGVAEGLTFGLMGRDTAAKGIESARQGVMNFFGGGDKKEQPATDSSKPAMATTPTATPAAIATPTVKRAPSTAGEIATANVKGAGPDWKYIEEQRAKRATVTPVTTVSGEPPSTAPSSNNEVTAADSAPKTIEAIAMEEAKKFGRDKPNVEDKKVAAMKFKKQQLQGKSEGVVKGVVTDDSAAVTSPAPSTAASQTVSDLSQENAEMKEGGQAAQPVVINNSSSVATNTQTFTPLRASARPNNNSFERKQNMAASF